MWSLLSRRKEKLWRNWHNDFSFAFRQLPGRCFQNRGPSISFYAIFGILKSLYFKYMEKRLWRTVPGPFEMLLGLDKNKLYLNIQISDIIVCLTYMYNFLVYSLLCFVGTCRVLKQNEHSIKKGIAIGSHPIVGRS